MYISLFPPLYVLKTSSELTNLFQSSDSRILFSSVKFDSTTNKLIINADLTNDLVNINSFQILFNPEVSSNSRYFATEKQNIAVSLKTISSPLFYYSNFTLINSKAIYALSYLIVIIGWISFILGVIWRRLAGL